MQLCSGLIRCLRWVDPMTLERDQEPVCAICGEAATVGAFLHDDPFFLGVRWHVLCVNSAQGRQWRREREEADPGYRRYVRLASQGVRVRCPECGSEDNFLWPKLQGHSPEIEASCDRCERTNYGALNPYANGDAAREIQQLSEQFRLGRHPGNLAELVQELAAKHDHLIRPRQCCCGGRFSLSAKPRCRNCRSVVFDSYFHFVGEAPEQAALPFR